MTEYTAKLAELVAWLFSDYDKTPDDLDMESWVPALEGFPYPVVKRAVLTASRDQFRPRLGRVIELIQAGMPARSNYAASVPETLYGRYLTLGYCTDCGEMFSDQHWRENRDHSRGPVKSIQCEHCKGPTPCNCDKGTMDVPHGPWRDSLVALRNAGLEAAEDEKIEKSRGR